MAKRNGHGGRRHGLNPKGEAPAIKVRLSEEDRQALDDLVAVLARLMPDAKADRSKVVRALIRHPDEGFLIAALSA